MVRVPHRPSFGGRINQHLIEIPLHGPGVAPRTKSRNASRPHKGPGKREEGEGRYTTSSLQRSAACGKSCVLNTAKYRVSTAAYSSESGSRGACNAAANGPEIIDSEGFGQDNVYVEVLRSEGRVCAVITATGVGCAASVMGTILGKLSGSVRLNKSVRMRLYVDPKEYQRFRDRCRAIRPIARSSNNICTRRKSLIVFDDEQLNNPLGVSITHPY